MSVSSRPARILVGVLVIAACTATDSLPSRPPANAAVELNDVHSRLNATVVREVAEPTSTAELRRLIVRAGREGLAVSISGGRHAMGGQQFARDALHLDMSKFDRVVGLDRERGIVTVESGIGWPALIEELHALQRNDPQPWSIVQKQTGADELSIGGALSANAHGRGLAWKPFVQDVAGFRLMQADGQEIEVSRTRNPELFRLVIGGYGLFGVVTTVDLKLQRRLKLRRDVVVLPLKELPAAVAERTQDGYLYGDFQFKTDERAADFLTIGVFPSYRPVPPDTPLPEAQRSLGADDWRRLFALAHLDKARAFDAYRDFYLSTNGQVYWSDSHQLSYYDAEFDVELHRLAPDYPSGTLMITELYVPIGELEAFMGSVARDFRANHTNLIYGTVRMVRRDDETFLAWARQNFACIVMNLRVTHGEAGLRKAELEFQRLIDRALERGGSYFLTYHRWARKDQVLAAYPQFVEFLRLKRRYDPEERFQSEWYRPLQGDVRGGTGGSVMRWPARLQPMLLWTLQGLFALRVIGQVYVGLYAPDWLPPWAEWYSGLLPYPLLLPAQVLLFMWMTVVSYDNSRAAGCFHVQSERVRRLLTVIATIYAGVMLLRYVVTMTLKPEMRWLHGTIPIAFHWVLAGYIAVLSIPTKVRSHI